MFLLTCQEVLHNAVDRGFDCRHLLGHATERQHPARLDFNFTSRGNDLLDRRSYRRLSPNARPDRR